MTMNDFIIAEGNETRRALEMDKQEQHNSTQKVSYVRLNDGEKARGFLLTTSFVMIQQHKDWARGVKTHTCRDPKHGQDCYSCTMGIKTQARTIVPFWSVDQQEVQILYATQRVMKNVYAFIDEYDEDSTTTPIAISRTGTGKETNYTVMPTRVRTAERELFRVSSSVTVDKAFLMRVLKVPTNDEMRNMLAAAGIK